MHKEDDLWPFADPQNVVTFTVRQITNREQPILLVCHDQEDGSWQFLTGDAFNMEHAMLVCLREIVKLDSTVSQLADLPLGWQASRLSPTHAWVRSPSRTPDA